jgi:Spy/CpxP family protein refolding chaperone
MKNILIINLCIIAFLFSRPEKDFNKEHKNAKMIIKWKLIEYLDLSEDQSTQFFIMVNEFKKEVKELHKANKALRENIRDLIENDRVKKNDVDALVNDFFDNENKIQELRREHHLEVQKVLNSEQVIRYLIFDHKFKKGLKDKLHDRKMNKNFRSF